MKNFSQADKLAFLIAIHDDHMNFIHALKNMIAWHEKQATSLDNKIKYLGKNQDWNSDLQKQLDLLKK